MSVAPASIRCILFDLGSTLWEHSDEATWRAAENAAEARALAALGAMLPPAEASILDAIWADELHRRVHARIKASHYANLDEEPDFGEVTMLALRELGISRADGPMGAAIFEALRVRSLESRDLFSDVLATLATLQARGYALGVVTNRSYGGEVFLDDLRQVGLLAFFDPRYIAISADLGYRKPHPGIFRHALNGLAMPPAATAMVGDNLLADIWGAQQLGMFTVWKPNPKYAAAAGITFPEDATALGTTSHDALFALAQRRILPYDSRIAHITPPNATIADIGALTTIFL